MAIEPVSDRVTRLREDVYLITWPIEGIGEEELLAVLDGTSLEQTLKEEAGVRAVLALTGREVQAFITLPISDLGHTDDEVKHYIGTAQAIIAQRLGLDPATDKSIE